MPRRLLYVYRGEGQPARPAFADILEPLGWLVDCWAVRYSAKLHGIPTVLLSERRLSDYDLVVTNEYNLTWAVALRLLLWRRPKIAAIGFNQSSRLLLTGVRPVDWLLNFVWRRVSGFLVHSRDESRLFEKFHGIPADRFLFSHWGYDLPMRESSAGYLSDRPFVSMIGRNNRDIFTFCRAVELSKVDGIIVTSKYLADNFGQSVPDGVRLRTDRPMNECLNYVAGSFAHLVLLQDGERGAGHISAVTAMLLRRPQIFSAVATIEDYLVDGYNGIGVALRDAEAVAAAISRLRDDAQLSRQLGENGESMAREVMSHQAFTRRIADFLCLVTEKERGVSVARGER